MSEIRTSVQSMIVAVSVPFRLARLGPLLFCLWIVGCASNRLQEVQRGMPPGFERDWTTASDDVAMQQQILRATSNPNFRFRLAAITQRANQGDRQAQLTLALV